MDNEGDELNLLLLPDYPGSARVGKKGDFDTNPIHSLRLAWLSQTSIIGWLWTLIWSVSIIILVLVENSNDGLTLAVEIILFIVSQFYVSYHIRKRLLNVELTKMLYAAKVRTSETTEEKDTLPTGTIMNYYDFVDEQSPNYCAILLHPFKSFLVLITVMGALVGAYFLMAPVVLLFVLSSFGQCISSNFVLRQQFRHILMKYQTQGHDIVGTVVNGDTIRYQFDSKTFEKNIDQFIDFYSHSRNSNGMTVQLKVLPSNPASAQLTKFIECATEQSL